MKKIILLIISILSCYLIFKVTKEDKINYTAIGDSLSKSTTPYYKNGYGYTNYLVDYLKSKKKLKNFNDDFTNKDYRITDVINKIKANEKIKEKTINQIIKESDIITISLGMNEIYYKINTSDTNIYSYIDDLIKDMDNLLTLIRKQNEKQIYVLNYYNIKNNYQDIFNYANKKLEIICKNNKVNYVDIQKEFYKNKTYFENPESFNPNIEGYYKIYEKIIAKMENN